MPTSAKHTGWKIDPTAGARRLQALYEGTEIFDFDGNDMVVSQALTLSSTLNVTGAVELSAAAGLPDDISLELGTDDDSVLRHKSATLAANTTLSGVLTGTPVSQALAANSLMLSNKTANGDIAVYVNTGTVSEQAIFIDGSAKLLALGQTGWSHNIIEGSVKLTMGTPAAFATTQPTNAIVFKEGTAPVGAITTSSALFASSTVLRKIIADGTASNVET